jgi:hypothetical protein
MGAGTGDPARAGSNPASGSPVDGQDPIVRGVVSGGRVVDEWIRQAQQTARLLGGTASAGAWSDASGRMFRTASDFMAAWLSILGLAPPQNGAAAGASQPSYPETAWHTRPTPDRVQGPDAKPVSQTEPVSRPSPGPRVRLELASRRPVDVTVDMHRHTTAPFRVLDLRPEHGDAPRIQGTRLETWDSEGLLLRLVVPDDQPPGAYHAVVLDAVADCVVGTVTLRIPG